MQKKTPTTVSFCFTVRGRVSLKTDSTDDSHISIKKSPNYCQILLYGGGGVSLKIDGSWSSVGSCHSDSASRMGVGS